MEKEFSNLLDSAFELQKKGLLDEAKVIYEKILALYPENTNALYLYAQLLVQYKSYNQAISIYEKIFESTKLESIKYEIAKIYYLIGDFDISLSILEKFENKTVEIYELISSNAIKLNDINLAIDANLLILQLVPNSYNILFNISVLYSQINNIVSSLEFAYKALNCNNNDVNLFIHFASLFDNLQDKENLIICLEKILEFYPDNENFIVKLASEYISVSRKVDAVRLYERCLKINPSNSFALINLSKLMSEVKAFDKAIEFAKSALQFDSSDVGAYHSLYSTYMDLFDYKNAEIAANKIIELEPNNHLGYGCLANLYYEYIDYKKAINLYDRVLEYSNDNLVALNNKASCFSNLGRYDEALELIDKILSINPDYLEAIVLKTFIYLRNKDYYNAMNTYSYISRPDIKLLINNNKSNPDISLSDRFKKYFASNWNREDLSDKTLLLYNSDGYGDAIMFSRYIPLLEAKVKKLVIEVDKNLYNLYKENFKNSEIILETDKILSDYDFTTSYLLLFYNLNIGFDSIPSSCGFISADKNKIQGLDFNSDKLKLGIFWQGNKAILKNRMMNISDLIPLFDIENIQFFSLDITDKDEKTIEIFHKYNIIDCKKYINDFSDTASIIKNLDAVITIDSSIVHLAGSLGVKTYLMLPNNPEWRWFNDDKLTPWYDCVKIFKQKQQAHWEDVVLRIKEELLN